MSRQKKNVLTKIKIYALLKNTDNVQWNKSPILNVVCITAHKINNKLNIIITDIFKE